MNTLGMTDRGEGDRLSAIIRDSQGRRLIHPNEFFSPMPKTKPYPDPDPADLICRNFQMNSMISDSMKLNNIVVSESDPEHLKVYTLQAEGLFQCTEVDEAPGVDKTPDNMNRPRCHYEWKCYNVTIVIDLVKQEVVKGYKQHCWYCYQWCRPFFTNRQFAKIVQRVLKCYKRRKKAGGTVPSVENDGSHNSKAFQPHVDSICERCEELKEPCWLYLVPYFKKIPLSLTSFVQSSLTVINEPLHQVYAMANVQATSSSCRICINPLSGSESIKQWRKQCETILESFLKDLCSISLPLEPELLPKLQGVEPNSSLLIEEKTVLEIAGDAQEVSELIEKVQHIEKMVKEKRKPCIILW